MSLTMGTGPLAGHPGGSFNFEWQAPAHRLFFEAFPRRLRAVVDGRVVLDTLRARLLHETGIRAVPYAPLEDFDQALLERTGTSTHCPFKGDASYWTLRSGDRVVEDGVWAYEAPLEAAPWLEGYAALYFQKADGWFVEDDPVFAHLRDPYHRVDVFDSSRPVTVRAGDQVLASSEQPKLLYETGLPVRVYVPTADVAPGLLEPSEKTSRCPYKGEASYWSVRAAGGLVEDAAWGYAKPLPEALRVQEHVSFDADGIDVELGAPREAVPVSRL